MEPRILIIVNEKGVLTVRIIADTNQQPHAEAFYKQILWAITALDTAAKGVRNNEK